MQPIADWLSAIPKEAVPVVSAVVAAIVAVAVALLTQLVLGRRETTKLLTQKLEELYLQALAWQDERTMAEAHLGLLASGKNVTREAIESLIAKHTEQTAHRRTSMYIDLYFPPLRRYSRQVFEADRHFEMVIRKLAKGEQVTIVEVKSAGVAIQRVLAPLFSEIKMNRGHLTKQHLIVPRYASVDLPPRRSSESHVTDGVDG